MEQPLLAEAEWIEREAYRDLFANAGSSALRRRLGLSAESCGSALVLRSRALDHVLFNRTLGLQGAAPDADVLAESVVARYRAQGIARYFVQVGAPDDPCALCNRLQALGLTRYPRSWHKLVRGRSGPVLAPTPLRVERARASDAQALAALLAEGLELPDSAVELLAAAAQSPCWHAYVARAPDDVPYAGLLMYAQGELAYLALAATDRRERRRGAQRALIGRAVQDALDLGCRVLSAETGEAVPGEPNSSHHNLTQAGFHVADIRSNWTPAGTRWGSGR